MGEEQFLQWAAPLGVGGVLAAGMFLLYRRDTAVHIENWKGQSQILAGIVERNTAAITALTVQLDRVLDMVKDRER